MIIGSFGDDSLVTPSQATRAPFTRPVQATPNFVPTTPQTGFIPEFGPEFSTMLPQMPRIPVGIRNPLRSEPQGGGIPTMGPSANAMPADPSGQSSVPAGIPSPVKSGMGGRMFPPSLIMALGIMPPVRGVRAGRVNPMALVAAGRKVNLP
jgi:hypothetical protein